MWCLQVYQNIVEHCIGKTLYKVSVPALKRSRLSAWGVRDRGNWYLYVVNDYGSARSLSISLSSWGVATGAKVLVNEISGRYMNQVRTSNPRSTF